MRKLLIAGCLCAFALASCSPALPTATPPTEIPELVPLSHVEIVRNPPPCWEAELLYHSRIKQMVLVNCVPDSSKASLLTLWGWDGTQWQKLVQDGPPARILGGAAYDDVRDVLVVYGGRPEATGTCSQETWEWDGEYWEQINASPPTACSHIRMTYDAAIQKTVLFSGLDPEENPVHETWSWNGWHWKLVSEEGPESRGHFGLVYDPGHRQTLLYGGYANTISDEFWAWKNNTWEQIHVPGPGSLSHFGMTVETDPKALYVFGGATTDATFSSLTNTTWVLKDGIWEELHPASSPSERGGSALGYDPVRKRVVLYGGFDSGGNRLDDTWEWDGESWICRANCQQIEIQ